MFSQPAISLKPASKENMCITSKARRYLNKNLIDPNEHYSQLKCICLSCLFYENKAVKKNSKYTYSSLNIKTIPLNQLIRQVIRLHTQ